MVLFDEEEVVEPELVLEVDVEPEVVVAGSLPLELLVLIDVPWVLVALSPDVVDDVVEDELDVYRGKTDDSMDGGAWI